MAGVVVAHVGRFAPRVEVDPRGIAARRARLARLGRVGQPLGQKAELRLQELALLAAIRLQRPAATQARGQRRLPLAAIEPPAMAAQGERHRLQFALRPLVQPAAAPNALGGHDLAARRELRQGHAQVALQLHLPGLVHVGQMVGVQGHHVDREAVLGQHAAAAEFVDQVAPAHRLLHAEVVARPARPGLRLLAQRGHGQVVEQVDVLVDEGRGHVEVAVPLGVGQLVQPAPIVEAQFSVQRRGHNAPQRRAQCLRRPAQIVGQQFRAGGQAVAGGEERADP